MTALSMLLVALPAPAQQDGSHLGIVRLPLPDRGKAYRQTSFSLSCDPNTTDSVQAGCPDVDDTGTRQLHVRFRHKTRSESLSLCRTGGIVYQPAGQCAAGQETLSFRVRVREADGTAVPESCLGGWTMTPPKININRDKPSVDLALKDFTYVLAIDTAQGGDCHHLANGFGDREVNAEPGLDLRGRLRLDFEVSPDPVQDEAEPTAVPAAPNPVPTPLPPPETAHLEVLLTPMEVVDGSERKIAGLRIDSASLRLVPGTGCDGTPVASLNGQAGDAGIAFAGDIEYQPDELATVHAMCVDLEAEGYEHVQTVRLAHAPLESLLAGVTQRPLQMTPHPRLSFRVLPVAQSRAVQGRPASVRLVRRHRGEEETVRGHGTVGQSIVLEGISSPAGSVHEISVTVDGDEWTPSEPPTLGGSLTPTVRVPVGEPELDLRLRVTDAAHRPIAGARLTVQGRPVVLDPLTAVGLVTLPSSRWPERLSLAAEAECYRGADTSVDAGLLDPTPFGESSGSVFDVVLGPAPPVTYQLEVRFPRDGVDREPISIDTVQLEHGRGDARAWQDLYSSGADFETTISCLDAQHPVRYRIDAGDAFALADGELATTRNRVLLRYARPVLLVALHPAAAWRDTELGAGTMWADFLRHLYNFVYTEVNDRAWAEIQVETVRHNVEPDTPVFAVAPDLSDRLSSQPFEAIGFVGGGPPTADAVLERAAGFFAGRELPGGDGERAGALVYIAPRDPSARLDLVRESLEQLRDMGISVVFVQIDRGELEVSALAEMRRQGLGHYRVHPTATAADRFFRGVFEDLHTLEEFSR